MPRRTVPLVLALLLVGPAAAFGRPAPFPVEVTVNAGTPRGPVWRFFGADEPNYATMRDGKTLLAELGRLAPKQVYFRTHNLLTSGDGTPALKWGSTGAYKEDATGNPVYDGNEHLKDHCPTHQ